MLLCHALKIQITVKVSYMWLYNEKKCVPTVGSGISSTTDKYWHQEILRNTWKDGSMVIIKNYHRVKCEMEISGLIPSWSDWTKVQGHTNVRTHSLSWSVWSLLEKIWSRNGFEYCRVHAKPPKHQWVTRFKYMGESVALNTQSWLER